MANGEINFFALSYKLLVSTKVLLHQFFVSTATILRKNTSNIHNLHKSSVTCHSIVRGLEPWVVFAAELRVEFDFTTSNGRGVRSWIAQIFWQRNSLISDFWQWNSFYHWYRRPQWSVLCVALVLLRLRVLGGFHCWHQRGTGPIMIRGSKYEMAWMYVKQDGCSDQLPSSRPRSELTRFINTSFDSLLGVL